MTFDEERIFYERQSRMLDGAARVVAVWENALARDLDSLARIQERINVTLDRLESAKINQMRVADLLQTEEKTDGNA